jgi:ribosomal protein S18 acetylase RimI-like enzyme
LLTQERQTVKVIFDLQEADIQHLFGWLSDSGEISLISDSGDENFKPETIKEWAKKAEQSFLGAIDGRPIAFGTLSKQEAILPHDCIEICHLIVHPKFRRQYYGTALVDNLIQASVSKGISSIFARVLKNNKIGNLFFHSLQWDITIENEYDLPNNFNWYKTKYVERTKI